MKVTLLTTDNREMFKEYSAPSPKIGPAPEALLQGFEQIPEIEVHIVSCLRAPVKGPARLGSNLYFHPLIISRRGWLTTGYQGCIRKVRQCIKAIQPDIVHGQGTEKDNGLTAIFSGKPNVVTIHGNMVDIARALKARPGSYHWLTARLESFTLRRTAGVFCNSRYTEQRVAGRTPQIWRVPNALRLAFLDQPRTVSRRARCTILHIGTICEYKQQLAMLDVAQELHDHGLDFEFWFIGHADAGSPYAREFCARIEQAEQKGFARYLGTRSLSKLMRCLDEASALVHTPTVESFGLVVAEGIARNLKFFGMRVGGVPDIAEDVPSAVLVGAGDWTALAAEIAAWLLGGAPPAPPSAELMRKRYHPVAIAQRHIEIYRQVLSSRTQCAGTKSVAVWS